MAAARAVEVSCGTIGATSPSDLGKIISSSLLSPALHELDATVRSPSLAFVPLSPASFALCGAVLRQGLATSAAEDLDEVMCHRFIRTAVTADGALKKSWCAELVVDVCVTVPTWARYFITAPSPPSSAGAHVLPHQLLPTRWPLGLVSAQRALARAFVHAASVHECPVSAIAVAAIAAGENAFCDTGSFGSDNRGGEDTFAICLESARLCGNVVDDAVDWLWVALASLPPNTAVGYASCVWNVLSEVSVGTAGGLSDATVDLAVALLELGSPDGTAVASIAAGKLDDTVVTLVAMLADPWALVVLHRADTRHDAILERAIVGAMAAVTGFLASEDAPMSALFATHPVRPTASQVGCVLAAVLTVRSRPSSGGTAPLGRAVRWAAKVVGGSGTKTKIGNLFESCPLDSTLALVRVVKRIIEAASEQESKVMHVHLYFLIGSVVSLAVLCECAMNHFAVSFDETC